MISRRDVYNNYFVGSTRDPDYPITSEALGGHHYFLRMGLEFLRMGLESKIVSEYDAFRYDDRVDPADATVANLTGDQFLDRGSWVNGWPADLVAVTGRKAAAAGLAFTTDVGWNPADPYDCRPQRSVRAMTATGLREAGAR